MKRWLLTLLAICLALAFSIPAFCQDQAVPVAPEENAAFDYLFALAAQPLPRDVKRLEAEHLMNQVKTPKLPLRVLDDIPELLAASKDIDYTLGSIHAGAAKPKCQFVTDWSKGPATLLPHLVGMRALSRRCFFVALAREHEGNKTAAAEMYADLLAMGNHHGHEPDIVAALVGMSIQSIAVDGAEGLLARAPGMQPAEVIEDRLDHMPSWSARIATASLRDAEHWTQWVRQNPDGAFVLAELKLDGPPEARAAFAEAAADAYLDQANRWAKLVAQPYWQVKDALDAEEARVKSLIEQFKAEPDKFASYGLLKSLPSGTILAKRAAEADARIGMIHLACIATICQAEKGAYPADIQTMKRFWPAELPKDPFTGKDFLYSLKDGVPVIAAVAPPEFFANGQESKFRIDFSTRAEREAEALRTLEQNRKEVRKQIGVE